MITSFNKIVANKLYTALWGVFSRIASISCVYFFIIIHLSVELLTFYKQYVVVLVNIMHKLLNLWIISKSTLKYGAYFAMIIMLLL